MSFPTDQEHYDAVKAALAASSARPYGWGEQPVEDNYTLVTVSPRVAGSVRAGGVTGTRSVRVSILSVGRDVGNVNEMRRRADVALREVQLTVAGSLTSPIQLESGEPAGPDGDLDAGGSWFSASTAYTYTV